MRVYTALLCLFLLCAASSVYAELHESLVLLRVNDGIDHVLHFHGDRSKEAPVRGEGQQRVLMHSSQPVTGVEAQEGDELEMVHSSFPGGSVRAKVRAAGEWFFVPFPAGAQENSAPIVIRFMLVAMASNTQLLVGDHEEWVEPPKPGVHKLTAYLPHEFRSTIREVPLPQRAHKYREALGDKFMSWPPEHEEL